MPMSPGGSATLPAAPDSGPSSSFSAATCVQPTWYTSHAKFSDGIFQLQWSTDLSGGPRSSMPRFMNVSMYQAMSPRYSISGGAWGSRQPKMIPQYSSTFGTGRNPKRDLSMSPL